MVIQLTGEDPMRVFAPVRARDVRSLAGPVADVEVAPGTKLVREGQPVGAFFVIRSGTAELWCGQRRLGTLAAGDCFGETEPNATAPQRLTVVASSPMRVLAFSAFGIARLCAAIPGARERILASLPDPKPRARRPLSSARPLRIAAAALVDRAP